MLSLSAISKRAACAVLAVFAFSIFAPAEELPIRSYTVADGLLRDSVSRIRMDSRGFLWFCSVEGVSRFDGVGFTNFRVEDGLPDRHVNDVLETASGTFLIATGKGLARLEPRGIPGSQDTPLFTVFAPVEQQSQSIDILVQDSNGRIWAGTPAGLFRVAEVDGSVVFEKFPAGDVSAVTILEDRDGVIWVGGESNGDSLLLAIHKDGSFEKYSGNNGLPHSQIDSLIQTSDGGIFAGLRPGQINRGLVQLVSHPDPGQPIVEHIWEKKDGLPSNWIASLYQARDGKLWVGSTEGLCLWQGDRAGSVCRTFNAKNNICDRDIASFVEDKDSNLWIATGCGVKRLARYGFTIFGKDDHLENPYVSSLFETRSGDLIVNNRTSKFALSRFDGSSFQTEILQTPPNLYLGWGWKELALQDTASAWWVPTGDGLFRTPPGIDFQDLDSVRLTRVNTGLAEMLVFRLYADSSGDIWLATVGHGNGQLLRWRRADDRWENLTERAGFSKDTIGSVFVEDKNGNLWIATGSDGGDGRLIRYREGQFKTFTEKDGAPVGWTRDAYVDDAGRLWLANTASGLLRIDDVSADEIRPVRYTFAEGLSSSAVYCVTSDALGRIYVGTGRGLDRLRPDTGIVEHFTTADGLPSSYIELAYRDRKNTLWFGTSEGLVHYQPEPDKVRVSPRVLISRLQTGTRSQPVSILGEEQIGKLDLTSDENQVRVEFIGLGAALGEKLNFEYRLSDSANWQPTAERVVNFTNLAPGSYHFEIRAVSQDKLYSQPATITFDVAAPVWQRWWFILLVSVAAAAIVYLFYQNRLQRLLELERVRTRIATDLHDDIGANLTRISILSEVAKQKATNGNGEMLASIADIARESVASMNDIVWAVSPKHDSLADLITRMRRHAEEVFAVRDVRLIFDAEGLNRELRLGVGARRNLLLIYKEAVNNIAKHASCSKVEIDLSVAGSKLVMHIADNGCAFRPEQTDGEGQGIESMKRRAKGIGGDISFSSEHGRGTSIMLEVPLSHIDQG